MIFWHFAFWQITGSHYDHFETFLFLVVLASDVFRSSRSFRKKFMRVEMNMNRAWFLPSCWHLDWKRQWHFFLPKSTVNPNLRRSVIPDAQIPTDKLVVIFDLDETLVHSQVIPEVYEDPREWSRKNRYDGNITDTKRNYAYKMYNCLLNWL